jgi:hypothetical protein
MLITLMKKDSSGNKKGLDFLACPRIMMEEARLWPGIRNDPMFSQEKEALS